MQMKTVINKSLYNFAKAKIQSNRKGGQIKNSALAKKLYEEYHFGKMDLANKHLTFTLDDIFNLSEETRRTLGVDVRNDDYPSKQDREENAENKRNEKENSLPVSKDFILINSLSELKINKNTYPISPYTSLGHYIKAEEIQSIEHKYIIFVENLAVMASLSKLDLTLISEDLTDALWVYRGDVKKQQSTGTAYEFFRRFNSHSRICFSDVDPKGIEIALTSHADYWLTIKNIGDFEQTTQLLIGNEEEWFKQQDSIKFLQKKILLQQQNLQNMPAWQPLFLVSSKMQKTLKQEHALKHNLSLTLMRLR